MMPLVSLLRRRLPSATAALLAALLISGCFPKAAFEEAERKQKEAAAEREKKEKEGSIIGKTTQDIKKFDPNAGREVSDLKVRATSPLFYAAEAYGPMVGKISTLQIDQMLIAYNIEHDRWPTYEEFMEDIIKRHNVQLPVLPAKAEYHYDEENHKLLVVEHQEPEKDAGEKN